MELMSEGRWAVVTSGICCRDPSPVGESGPWGWQTAAGGTARLAGAVSEVCEGWLHRARGCCCALGARTPPRSFARSRHWNISMWAARLRLELSVREALQQPWHIT